MKVKVKVNVNEKLNQYAMKEHNIDLSKFGYSLNSKYIKLESMTNEIKVSQLLKKFLEDLKSGDSIIEKILNRLQQFQKIIYFEINTEDDITEAGEGVWENSTTCFRASGENKACRDHLEHAENVRFMTLITFNSNEIEIDRGRVFLYYHSNKSVEFFNCYSNYNSLEIQQFKDAFCASHNIFAIQKDRIDASLEIFQNQSNTWRYTFDSIIFPAYSQNNLGVCACGNSLNIMNIRRNEELLDQQYYCDYCDTSWRCERCDTTYAENEDKYEINGKIICSNCQSDANYCNDCEEHTFEDVRQLSNLDIYVCDSCYENYARCDNCNDYHLNDNLIYIKSENKNVCENCLTDYTLCKSCDEYFKEVNENNLCENCAKDEILINQIFSPDEIFESELILV